MTVSSATPPPARAMPSLARQSLSRGDLGAALLSAVRTDNEGQTLELAARSTMPLLSGQRAGIFLGAPALTFVLHVAGWKGPAMDRLDAIVAAHVRARLAVAHDRIDAGRPAAFAEYDLMHGLAGVGTLLLARRTDLDTTKALLAYLVRLTELVRTSLAGARPGWWVWHQHSAPDQPGPHANAGLAHGITGPLAVLALAIRRNIRVPGDLDAIGRILAWFDDNRHLDGGWARWTGDREAGPRAPSWCYGTPGVARAQQLAAIVTGDTRRKQAAEMALAACLTDRARLDALTGSGLCHGPAGTLQVVRRAAADAGDPHTFDPHLTELTNRLRSAPEPRQPGLLEGLPGVRLVLDHPPAPHTPGWDTCLGIV
ncbi:lanthionine synthetase C family protein [Promicromonospora sp. NPDC023805]|uniref:lanthionine synthetase C family protein n=1 Tax=Promicromonospora sp. NPDC023805 TaxID=3154696 RepID=UPI0034039D53